MKPLTGLILVIIVLGYCFGPCSEAKKAQVKRTEEVGTYKVTGPFELVVHGKIAPRVQSLSDQKGIAKLAKNEIEFLAWQSQVHRGSDRFFLTDQETVYRYEVSYQDGKVDQRYFMVNEFPPGDVPCGITGKRTAKRLADHSQGEFLMQIPINEGAQAIRFLTDDTVFFEATRLPYKPVIADFRIGRGLISGRVPSWKVKWQIDNPGKQTLGLHVFYKHGERSWSPHGNFRQAPSDAPSVEGGCDILPIGDEPLTVCLTVTNGVEAWEIVAKSDK